jgi:IclR family pca regulon transcriptional regulator
LLLALSDAAWVEHWQDTQVLKAYTSHTITSKERLRIELARVRAQGWALSEQQLELGARGIAVPLMDHRGDLVGALSVTTPIGFENSEDAVARVLPVLQETARAMRNLI